jgi:hypothetical protein
MRSEINSICQSIFNATTPKCDEFVSRIDFFDCFNYIVYIRLYKEN